MSPLARGVGTGRLRVDSGSRRLPYPSLAQHALRAARVLAANIVAVLEGREPRPFLYRTLGMMGSLGHYKGFGQLLKVRLHGFPAWFVRRTYYLLQMPGWSRRLRIMIDWTFALLFPPDIVKIGLDSDIASLLHEAVPSDAVAKQPKPDNQPAPRPEPRFSGRDMPSRLVGVARAVACEAILTCKRNYRQPEIDHGEVSECRHRIRLIRAPLLTR